MKTTAVLIALLLVIACKQASKPEKVLPGEWSLEKVFEYGNDVSRIYNPDMDRWIRFNTDDDDSEWSIFVSGDTLFITGIGHPRKENTRLVHVKMNRYKVNP
jgi:hypothetical protein